MVTESGDLVVLGVHRDGEALGPGEVVLAAGDALLVRGTWQALAEQLPDDDVVVVDEPAAVRRQVVPLGPRGQGGPRRAGRRWWSSWPPGRSRPRWPRCWPPGPWSC